MIFIFFGRPISLQIKCKLRREEQHTRPGRLIERNQVCDVVKIFLPYTEAIAIVQ